MKFVKDVKSYLVKGVSPTCKQLVYDIVGTSPSPPPPPPICLSFQNFKKGACNFANEKGGVSKIGEVVLEKGLPYFYTN